MAWTIWGRNNSVDVENVRGAVDVQTSYKDIVVRNPGGPVELANRHGDIRVFFDAPPLMGVSDASILASEVDGVLLVIQYRKYPRTMSTRAKRVIENVGGKIIGVVLNNINIMRDDYYYYYH